MMASSAVDEYNNNISIISEGDLKISVPNCLDIKYLEKNYQEIKFPVKGRIDSQRQKNFISLICRYKNNPPINVYFSVETGNILITFEYKKIAN